MCNSRVRQIHATVVIAIHRDTFTKAPKMDPAKLEVFKTVREITGKNRAMAVQIRQKCTFHDYYKKIYSSSRVLADSELA